MVSQSCGHGRGTSVPEMFSIAQFVMWEAKVIRASNQKHPRVQHLQTMNRMTALSCQRSKTLSHRSIETLDKRGVELLASFCSLQQLLRFFNGTSRDLASDFHHTLLFCALDHGRNTQIRPLLQTTPSRPSFFFTFSLKTRAMLFG